VKDSDSISKDEAKYRIINRYPEKNEKIRKDVEKKLYEVFKKYENKND